jgi:hypothetical protein
MRHARLNLALADLILRGIGESVGCRVDTFAVHVAGPRLTIDVLDATFEGTIPVGKLGPHLLGVIEAATGLAIREIGRCTNEGGTLTICISTIEKDELLFEVGV